VESGPFVQVDRFFVQADRFFVQGNRFFVQADRFFVQGNRFVVQADRFFVQGNRFVVQVDRFFVQAVGSSLKLTGNGAALYPHHTVEFVHEAIPGDDDESVAEGDRIFDLGGDGTGRRLERRTMVCQREGAHKRIVGIGRLAVHPELVELIICKHISSFYVTTHM
jgi:hypothetical protein